VLFQVYFLALLLEEREAGDLAQVAEHCVEKLVRRHPHVFGEESASTAGEVLRNWDRIKSSEAGREPGLFGDIPSNLPGLLYARKVQRRAASGGFDFASASEAMDKAHEEVGEVAAVVSEGSREERFHEIGDALFALVAVARKLHVDPELAVRAAADRFRGRFG
jgi:MazG family protein